ncbi:hypothetical protein [Undibacterium terreum]|uniref:Uncharacterized protein n=1 Tax=Undibacterium terreum TaxID=1224302 RepID=A0A916UTY9_9BURK|nr:hypothetical protein [Undibacterium terreum]GGC87505.1 hypothetical protein GCM10011396_38470 [Undibacterium terreum]
MKHSMMRVAVAATLGFAALAANAGQIGVNVGATLAAESITSTVVIAQPTITYQTASLINDGATVQVHVRFSAGSTKAADGGVLPLAADIGLFLNGAAVAPANYTITGITADTDGLGYYFTLTAVAGKGGIPSATVVNILTGNAKIASLTSALGTGGTVSTTVGYTAQAGDFSGVTTFVEPVSTAVLFTSKKALSQVAVNSNAIKATYFTTAEAGQVNVATSLTTFTGASPTAGTTKINLGATKLVLDTTLKNAGTGAAIAAADVGTTVFTATGDFSVAGASVILASDQACTATVAAGTISTDGKTATFAAETAAVATANNFLCYTIPGTKTVPYGIQYAFGGAAVAAGTSTLASTQTGGNVYFLKSNGASVTVPSFVPTTGALGAGYNTYLRVINTGNLTSDISVAAYNSTTGVAGTPVKLITQLPAGGSANLDTNTVTAALGLPAGWSALLVTGSTSQLAVQPLLVNPQGVITNLSAINGGNNAATAN